MRLFPGCIPELPRRGSELRRSLAAAQSIRLDAAICRLYPRAAEARLRAAAVCIGSCCIKHTAAAAAAAAAVSGCRSQLHAVPGLPRRGSEPRRRRLAAAQSTARVRDQRPAPRPRGAGRRHPAPRPCRLGPTRSLRRSRQTARENFAWWTTLSSTAGRASAAKRERKLPLAVSSNRGGCSV